MTARLKRTRLVEAAKSLIHHRGYYATTLADIAHAAKVPPGNVYYYFKTKADIAVATITDYRDWFGRTLDELNGLPHPRQRLNGFLDIPASQLKQYTTNGCPIGSLCQELAKSEDRLLRQLATILADQIAWVTRQFELLHRPQPESAAIDFIARLQGAILLAQALEDKRILAEAVERLRREVMQ
jgi:AcrR family transcriptional regulator